MLKHKITDFQIKSKNQITLLLN